MPKIYEYLGIVIMFYSDEHEPIHVHAIYAEATIKVSFFIEEGEIYRVTYKETHGHFPNAKLKEFKKFISYYKKDIVLAWDKYFIWKSKVNLVLKDYLRYEYIRSFLKIQINYLILSKLKCKEIKKQLRCHSVGNLPTLKVLC